MLSRPRVAIGALIIVAVVLTACGRDTTAEPAAPPGDAAPQVVIEKPTSEPSPTQAQQLATVTTPAATPEGLPVLEPTEEPEVVLLPEPTEEVRVNGSVPHADEVSLAPSAEALTTVDVVKRLTPSVVHIGTEVQGTGVMGEPTPGMGVGTGIILDDRGHILTNNHVVAGARRITVTVASGQSYPATVVGGDAGTDLAVIRIEAVGYAPATLGDSDTLEVGEDVIAIGHALGLRGGPTVSKGVVSALGRSINLTPQMAIVDLIQTDASINPGNSGGPLVNDMAEVIGINAAIIQSGRGIGFAININDAKLVSRQLIEKGRVERGFLGITPFNLNPALANQFNIPVVEGVIIQRAIPGTGAADAGLREGDVIVQLGDTPIRNTGELSKFLIAHPAEETVNLVFYRGQTKITSEITLGKRPDG